MDKFRDRVVLITGAGSGIGRQLARLLAAEGGASRRWTAQEGWPSSRPNWPANPSPPPSPT